MSVTQEVKDNAVNVSGINGASSSAINSTSSSSAQDNPHADIPEIVPQSLSKNAQKKAAKAGYLAEKKLERRAREKAAKKEKKREKREREAAGDDEDEEDEPRRKKAKKNRSARPFNARIVVDLGFDEKMNDKEISSLSGQLAYTYSANRKANCPFTSLLYTTLNGRLRTRLDGLNDAGYRRWTGTEWWEEGYDHLWAEKAEESEGKDGKPDETRKRNERSRSDKDKVVYLTADADEELEELKEGETYIIGGICDHNRYKNLCQNKAVETGIRSARLPIGKYLAEMTTRKVLTVNQVFEILVHWTESRNWEEALYSVMPKRKFQQSHKPQSANPVQEKETGISEKDAPRKVESDGLTESQMVGEESYSV
ncbi:guanine-1-methyltransferase-domain-containing protein [Phellopilus nigrolimitatus]|nr:guanine-1-methyltransferase-domain-containing protein [Phellopilus nigrolimitatus]